MTVGSAMSAQAEAARAWKDAVRALAIAEDAFDAVRARAERAYGHGGWDRAATICDGARRLGRPCRSTASPHPGSGRDNCPRRRSGLPAPPAMPSRGRASLTCKLSVRQASGPGQPAVQAHREAARRVRRGGERLHGTLHSTARDARESGGAGSPIQPQQAVRSLLGTHLRHPAQ